MNEQHSGGSPSRGRADRGPNGAGDSRALRAKRAAATWLAASLTACCLASAPALAQNAGTPPKPTVGEGQGPRQDGTTRSGAPAPMPSASASTSAPQSAQGQQQAHDRNHKGSTNKGTSTPRPSDSGSILGTPK